MLMALDPNVKELCVFDLSVAMVPPAGVAADLGHLERKSDVKGYVMEVGQKPIDNLKECLTGCDLVLVPAGMPRKPGMTRDDLFKVNADIAKGIVEACAKFCPEAVLGLIVNPVNSIVPAMAELYKKKGLDPLKIVGITTLDVVRANKRRRSEGVGFSGEITGKNPNYINARGTEGPLFPESRPLSTGVPRVAVGSSSGFVEEAKLVASATGFTDLAGRKHSPCRSRTSEQLQVARRAEKGLAKSSSGIQAEKKYDGILDELEEAAVIQEQDEGEEGEEEEDSWKGIKETFGWVLVADVFIIIGLSIWLIVGFALAQLFNIDQVYLAFTNLWDPYIQSLIGILFGARVTGIALQWLWPLGSQTFHHEIRIMLSSTSLCTCQLRSVSCHVSRVWSELRALHGTTERRLVAKTIDAEKIPDLDKRAGTDVVNAKSGKGSATLSMAYAGPA
ncbi:Malate dehydrogenase [Durusdinium trenchii]|uniref:malate dehydrogenase n=1 Tax=Durusdinium trenchii TaxID=1381693 RepID=A0ABP0S631_9DINO